MAKKKSPPAKAKASASDGKAPLVVALAFFVLTTIVAGVLAFMYEGDIEAAQNKAKTAKDTQEIADTSQRRSDELNRLYRVAIGTATAEDLERIKTPQDDGPLRDEHRKIMAAINGKIDSALKADPAVFGKLDLKPEAVFRWPWPAGAALAGGPPISMPERMVQLISEREQALAYGAAQKKLYEEGLAKTTAEKALYEKDKANFAVALAAKDADVVKYKKEKDDEVEKRIKDYEAATKTYTTRSQKADEQIQPLLKEKEFLQNELAQLREELKIIKSTINPQRTVQFDNPIGSITAVFARERSVEIDLGSADKVRVGLTFSVYPREAKDRGSEKQTPKAMLEVIEVVSANLSRARVTHFSDELRTPIVKGDLLYNIAWQKGRIDHVVLFGLFDIDGDGTDDIKTVARDLQKMGVAVDGYFDLATRKWIGNPPSYRTDYAVVGAVPTVLNADGLAALKADLINSVNVAEAAAKEKGVTVIRSREFFTGIGYKVRNDVPDDVINQAASKFLRAPEAAPAAPAN